MSPVALLFSSDEETSLQVVQALSELELEIERCPDIFTAIEWLTSRSFDAIVADWDSGPEAAFLLKNARELKLNKAAFTLAFTSGVSNLADKENSPDLILTKPLLPDQVKYAVLSNDRFLGCMKAWIARGDFAQPERPTPAARSGENVIEQRQQLEPSPTPPAVRPPQRSPASGYACSEVGAPLHLTFASLDRQLFRAMNRQSHGGNTSGKIKRYIRNRLLWGSILTVSFVSVGLIFGQPLRIQSVFASVATAYKQALEMKSSKFPSSESDTSSDSAPQAQPAGSQVLASGRPRRGIPALPMLLPDEVPDPPAETLQDDLDQSRLVTTPSQIRIPESLKTPLAEAANLQTVSLRRSPSLLSQLEPVSLPEDLSRALLLQKVAPSYPEQALKAGLQGAVVLQAWIGKDGSIRDLKLMDGSLLLGQAAVKAVKQWRYKPYLRNGIAVEAQTYVTVNFRLP
jgi:TonB family protein